MVLANLLVTSLLFASGNAAFAQLPSVNDRPLSPAERERLSVLEGELQRISVQRRTSLATLRAIAAALGTQLAKSDPVDLIRLINARADEFDRLKASLTDAEQRVKLLDSRQVIISVRPLLTQARGALDRGDLTAADGLFARVAQTFRVAREQRSSELGALVAAEADTTAERARLALIGSDYARAAALYGEAVAITGVSDPMARWRYLTAQADVLRQQGIERGEPAAYDRAKAILETQALPLVMRETHPIEWATTQFRLGELQCDCLLRASTESALDSAGARIDAAQSALDKARHPALWAQIEHERARIHHVRAMMKDDMSGVPRTDVEAERTRALEAIDRALAVRTRAADARAWATSQNLRGKITGSMVSRTPVGKEMAAASIDAFRAALTVQTPETNIADYADSTTGLLNSMSVQSFFFQPRDGMSAIVTAYDEAERVITSKRLPVRWAKIRLSRGAHFASMYKRGRDDAFEPALAAYESVSNKLPAETDTSMRLEVLSLLADHWSARGWRKSDMDSWRKARTLAEEIMVQPAPRGVIQFAQSLWMESFVVDAESSNDIASVERLDKAIDRIEASAPASEKAATTKDLVSNRCDAGVLRARVDRRGADPKRTYELCSSPMTEIGKMPFDIAERMYRRAGEAAVQFGETQPRALRQAKFSEAIPWLLQARTRRVRGLNGSPDEIDALIRRAGGTPPIDPPKSPPPPKKTS